ncbi:hypothetical protein BELL_0835g00020 [Botrytis elliptica]|uniref:RING-type domain-containing protein n=1 Tax=Botrytis elliptica TaxID=278938 RepID=A0A4Z1J3Y2_9HELO|nr:hypothetical protein EAE99_007514 [Botrytis elliptica]TGO68311.1 hypothetical protein BELL_0835g00020 [Botrytis elliptica]
MERLLSRCTSVLGVQIWSPDPALVKAVREMFCFCIHVVCQMQLFARSPIFEGQFGRHFFEMVGRLREKSDPLSQACLKIFVMDLSLITQESHATSCCPICQLDHQTPYYSGLLHPEDEGEAPLKILPLLNEIPRLSKPDECAVCYGPNYTPVATIPCGHKNTCLTCIIRWTKSEEEAPPNGCPYCRAKIARLELLMPYPRFQIEESQMESKYSLARPFAETEMGYEEMEKRQKEVMEVVNLVGAWIWRVSKEDRKMSKLFEWGAGKVNSSIDGSGCGALDWWYNNFGDDREENTEVGDSRGIYKDVIIMAMSIVKPSSLTSVLDSSMFLSIWILGWKTWCQDFILLCYEREDEDAESIRISGEWSTFLMSHLFARLFDCGVF